VNIEADPIFTIFTLTLFLPIFNPIFTAADIQCAIDMHYQLGLACAECRKRGNSGELALLYLERGTRVNIVKHKLHQIAFEIRRGFSECVCKALSSRTSNSTEILQTLFIAI